MSLKGLEKPGRSGSGYDTKTQKALDKTLDEIKQRFGQDKAIHALELPQRKK